MHFILSYSSVPDFVHRRHGAMAGPMEGPGVPPVSQPQPLDRGVVCAAGEAARHGAALVILGVDHATTENTLILTQLSLMSSLVTVLCIDVCHSVPFN